MKRRNFIRQTTLGTGAILLPVQMVNATSIGQKATKEIIHPFLWGTAYYRAPEPEPSLWENDFKKMRDIGFTDVKYLVQWRWSHIKEDHYYFDDTKKLLDLAAKYKLRVTLNFLFDVSPHWLFDKYPDAKPVLNNGKVVEPFVAGHRAIGGHPGPCYNHEGARKERMKFLDRTVSTFSDHPAMHMWDVWNEPELCYPQRNPITVEKLACYCANCSSAFKEYLRNKYDTLELLNDRWGRNYQEWHQVEMARSPEAFLDFIDWREFHGRTLFNEAAWRIKMVREKDPIHTVFLHVVPNTMNPFNAVTTCVNDFEMADLCDVFAATTIGPLFTTQLISAGRGKVCYNVECHINGGNTSTHQKIIDLQALLKDFVPQLGLGIKGFMFWQFRPEVLGQEAPAWGVVNLDGSDREVTKACRTFWKTIQPFTSMLMTANPVPDLIGVWKNRKNEIFQYCVHHTLNSFTENVDGYVNTLYWNNYSFRYISGNKISDESIESCKVLIMPSAYYLTEEEAEMVVSWVKAGGVLIAEAHMGGYNGTTGRHSRLLPGCGLQKAFGIKEETTTSSFHLNMEKAEAITENVTADTKKALISIGITGARYFPVSQADGTMIWGDSRYAELSGDNIEPEGFFEKGKPCAVSKPLGKGYIYYYGTLLGSGSAKDSKGLTNLIDRACKKAGVQKILKASAETIQKFRVDVLQMNGEDKFITIHSMNDEKIQVSLSGNGLYVGLFSQMIINLNEKSLVDFPAGFTDLFVKQ